MGLSLANTTKAWHASIEVHSNAVLLQLPAQSMYGQESVENRHSNEIVPPRYRGVDYKDAHYVWCENQQRSAGLVLLSYNVDKQTLNFQLLFARRVNAAQYGHSGKFALLFSGAHDNTHNDSPLVSQQVA
jgi:hypothetical protein